MKPEQFIREYGVDKARDLLDQLHKLGCPDDMKITVINGMWQRTSNGFTYPELKRLVKSVEIINQAGGYEVVKTAISNYRASGDMVTFSSLEKRLKDHESIYGGGDE